MSIQVSNPYAMHPAAGGGGPTITLTNQSIAKTVSNPTDSYCGYKVLNDGTVDKQEQTLDLGWAYVEDWTSSPGAGAGDDYEVKATKTAGTNPSGDSLGVWLALTSDRKWQSIQTSIGTNSCTLTIEIRDAATETLQDSCSVTMNATVDF